VLSAHTFQALESCRHAGEGLPCCLVTSSGSSGAANGRAGEEYQGKSRYKVRVNPLLHAIYLSIQGDCAGGDVPLGAVPALSWWGEVSLGGILINHPAIYPSIYLSIDLSIYLSIDLYICIYGCISMQRYWSSLLRYCPRDSVFVGCQSSSSSNDAQVKLMRQVAEVVAGQERLGHSTIHLFIYLSIYPSTHLSIFRG